MVLIVAVLALGCNGRSADDIAREVDDAIAATKSRIDEVPDSQAEPAAGKTACDALGAYSSEPAQSLSEYLKEYAQRQRVLAQFGLNEVDPDTADRLADAMEDIENSQDAAEVGDKLGCSI